LDSTAAAITYLDKLQRMFDGDWLLAIAAYNSGEGKVRRELRRAGGDATFWELRLPRETRAYVPRLLALSRLVAAPGDFGITLPEVIDTPQFEVVQTGGQLDLAVAAELTGLSVDTLYRFNPGLNRWATPPQGPHRLLIPANYAGLLRDGLAELPAAQRVTWKRYRIAPGDTLSSIAAAHRITIESLRDSNDLRGSMIRAGQYLMIPTASRKSRDYRLSASQRLQQRTVATARDVEYTVRPGDSLWTIARGYGVDVRRLASWNGMAPKDTLQAGRRLVIRDVVNDDPAVVGPPSTQRRINYTVRRGDSLARISSKFSVSIAQIRKWNRNVANQKYLYPGQKLVMYIDVTRQSGG
ncbi:MAG: LysM peptidoglycan-binding domain-containing protein, partial [Gammaproteobacteria bacterium]|nr:LysM peptidoglycan-binding domain-containing protein [Gammaproteobacteria bacterium]